MGDMGNNMQMVFRMLAGIGAPVTLADVREALPLHPRSVEDALRALVRGGYVCVRYQITDGATCPLDARGRKRRGGMRGARK